MTNNDQSTVLLYCCADLKSHRSGGDTVPLISNINVFKIMIQSAFILSVIF